jgi:hypothetical protein
MWLTLDKNQQAGIQHVIYTKQEIEEFKKKGEFLLNFNINKLSPEVGRKVENYIKS